jgi:DnaJ-class molecular chaperone
MILCDGEGPDPEDMGGMGGMGGFPFGAMGGMGGMGGLFEQMGQMGGRGPQRPQSCPDQIHQVNLTLSDIFNGTTLNISIPIQDRCGGCAGSGSTTKTRINCAGCKGNGVKIRMVQVGPGMISQQQTVCGDCGGKGKIVDPSTKCAGCKGCGTIESKVSKSINVPKLFDYETVMLMKSAGDYHQELDKKSDIKIAFVISDFDKSEYKQEGTHNLLLVKQIEIGSALSGLEVYLDSHPDQTDYSLKFDRIIKDGDKIFIKNLGLPMKNHSGTKRGKLYIQFKYIYPNEVLNVSELTELMNNLDVKPSNSKTYIKCIGQDISLDDDNSEQKSRTSSRRSNNTNNSEGVNCAQS